MPLSRQVDAVDSVFATLNTGAYTDAYTLKSRPSSRANSRPISRGTTEAGGLGWSVVTQGVQQNYKDGEARKAAGMKNDERRRMKELQHKLNKERRNRDKLKALEMSSYRAARDRLLEKEFSARMETRPKRWEVRGSVDVQRRRKGLRALTGGEFTSIRKPVGFGEASWKKEMLEPVLLHWMPQFEKGRLETTDKTEEHRGNLMRMKQVKAAVSKQKWVSMMNSGENGGIMASVNKGMMKKGGAGAAARGGLEQLTGLMQSQATRTLPDGLAKQELRQISLVKDLKGR